jgi:hypothetical protein
LALANEKPNVYRLTKHYVASGVKNKQYCSSHVSGQLDFDPDPDPDFDESISQQMA